MNETPDTPSGDFDSRETWCGANFASRDYNLEGKLSGYAGVVTHTTARHKPRGETLEHTILLVFPLLQPLLCRTAHAHTRGVGQNFDLLAQGECFACESRSILVEDRLFGEGLERFEEACCYVFRFAPVACRKIELILHSPKGSRFVTTRTAPQPSKGLISFFLTMNNWQHRPEAPSSNPPHPPDVCPVSSTWCPNCHDFMPDCLHKR